MRIWIQNRHPIVLRIGGVFYHYQSHQAGWIEEKSLVLLKPAPTATVTPGGTQQVRQFFTSAVQIREVFPLSWIRSLPSSTACYTKARFLSPKEFQPVSELATVGTVVRWDGHQWWRAVVKYVSSTIDLSRVGRRKLACRL